MGVQKSKASSVHKYTRQFIRVKKIKQKITSNKQLKFFKFITKFAHLTNLLLEYFTLHKFWVGIEVFIQISIAYSLIQLFKQVNFFFTLAYFLTLVVTVGISMIFFGLDLGAIILWIIYGGVITIFFLYATMWSESIKSNIFFYDYRLIFFFFYVYIFYMFIDTADQVALTGRYWGFPDYQFKYFFILDSIEELETLGAGFFFFSLFYFIICTIALVVSCFSIVVIILTLKKLKANTFFSYLFFSKDFISWFFVILLKNQHFFNQEQENTYLQNSIYRVYKISVKFHRNKMNYRRI